MTNISSIGTLRDLYTARFVASWSRSRLGCLKVRGVVTQTPFGIPQVLWHRGRDTGWDTAKVLPLRDQAACWDILSFVASWPRSRFEIPEVLRLRGQDPAWYTSKFVDSLFRYRKFYGIVV